MFSSMSTNGIFAKAPNPKIIVIEVSLLFVRMHVYSNTFLKAIFSSESFIFNLLLTYLVRILLAPMYPVFRITENGLICYSQNYPILLNINAPVIEFYLEATISALKFSGG